MFGAEPAAELGRMVVADLLDRLQSLSLQSDSYPGWARVLFGVTLALVLVSAFVYALLFGRVARHEAPKTEGGST